MGDISFSCPHCGQTAQVSELLLGRTIPCPFCKEQISLAEDGAPDADETNPVEPPQKSEEIEEPPPSLLEQIPQFSRAMQNPFVDQPPSLSEVLLPWGAALVSATCACFGLVWLFFMMHSCCLPVPHFVLRWIPPLLAALIATGTFQGIAARGKFNRYLSTLALVVIFVVAAGGTQFWSAHRLTVLKARLHENSIAAVNNSLNARFADVPACVEIKVREIRKPGRELRGYARFEDDASFDVKVYHKGARVVSVSDLTNPLLNHLLPEILNTYLHTETPLPADIKCVSASVKDKRSQGFVGDAKLSDGRSLSITVRLKEKEARITLSDLSRITIFSVPVINALLESWKPDGPRCITVVPSRNVSSPKGIYDGLAKLSDGTTRAFILRDNPDKTIEAFLTYDDASMRAVNAMLDDFFESKAPRCVGIELGKEIRLNERAAKAMFVERAPVDVLLIKEGFQIKAKPGKFFVGTSISGNWSMLLPESFDNSKKTPEINRIVYTSPVEGISISLRSLTYREFSFDIARHVQKEVKALRSYLQSIEGNEPTIGTFRTETGLEGQVYTTFNNQAGYIAYGFLKNNHLIIVSFFTSNNRESLQKRAEDAINTLSQNLRRR